MFCRSILDQLADKISIKINTYAIVKINTKSDVHQNYKNYLN